LHLTYIKKEKTMSSENIEKFYAKAYSEPELGAALNNLLNPQDMVTSIVALGEAHGCSFTTQEAAEFLVAMSARNDKGELDDLQLEAVAGGKRKPAPLSSKDTQLIMDASMIVAGALVSAVPGGKA
jgi:hypothetical protein